MTSKTKTILGISLAAVFAVSMIAPQVFANGPSYLDIVDAKLVEQKNNVVLKMKVAGNIAEGIDPNTNEGFFGYASLTDDGTGVLAVTYHEPIVDSLAQPGWHSHVVDLTNETVCESGLAVASASLNEPGHTVVNRNNIVVNQVSPDDVGNFNGEFASFELTVEGPEGAEEVCIYLADSFPA